jgi:hypothetical protein
MEKTQKRVAFFLRRCISAMSVAVSTRLVRKRLFKLRRFVMMMGGKSYRFAKTGSGQTCGKS